MTDVLGQLDWSGINCQCGHHAPKGCPFTAAHQVEVHAVDKCRHPNLNADGNAVAILCSRCLATLRASLVVYIARLNGLGQTRCSTCQHLLIRPEHVIRKAQHL